MFNVRAIGTSRGNNGVLALNRIVNARFDGIIAFFRPAGRLLPDKNYDYDERLVLLKNFKCSYLRQIELIGGALT